MRKRASQLQPLVIATAMFSLLSRRVAASAVHAPLRANSIYSAYPCNAISRTFFSGSVLADPAAKAAAKDSDSDAPKKPGRKPKAKKEAPKSKPKKEKKPAVPPSESCHSVPLYAQLNLSRTQVQVVNDAASPTGPSLYPLLKRIHLQTI